MNTQVRKQAYEDIMKLIDECRNSSNIDGKVMVSKKVKQFAEMNKLAKKLFSSPMVEIKSDSETDNTKPFHAVTVYLEDYEINTTTKAKFIELLNLADNVIVAGDENDKFHISFSVEGIWEEQSKL